MKKRLSILKKVNDKTAEDINQKYPADWDMDRIFKSSYKKYIRHKQETSDIAHERVNNNMTDKAVDIKIFRKAVLLNTIAVLAILAVTAATVVVFWTKNKEHHEHKPLVTENYFVEVNYTIPECVYGLSNIIKSGDRVVISGNMEFSDNELVKGMYSMESENGNGLCITDMSGKIISKTKLRNGLIQNIFISDYSDIYVYMRVDQYDSNGKVKGIPAYVIEHLDMNGTLIDSTQLDIDNEFRNPDMLVDSEGRYVFTDTDTFENISNIYLLDTDGSVVSQLKCEEGTQKLHIFKNEEGVFQISELNNITQIRKIDFENKTTEEIAQADFIMQNNNQVFCGNNVYDFFMAENDGIYGYNLKDNKLTEIVNYIESDISYRINGMWVSDEDNFSYGYYENRSSDTIKFSLMTRADDETLKKISGKKVITVACNTPEVWDCAAQFNKNNEEYRIKAKSLSEYQPSGNPLCSDCSFGKLNEDIIKGNIADVIIWGQEFDVSRFASMGVFADINELMENDSEISRSDFFENILDAYQTGGKLYYMPLNFDLNTLSGKMSVLGERDMLTYDQFFEMNNKQSILKDENRYDLMNMFIRNNLSEFVDFSDRKCNFDNKNFTQLLEFIKTSGLSSEESNDLDRDDFYKRVADDRCSCFMYSVCSYKEQSRDEQINYGKEKDVSYIGLPSGDGGSAVVQSNCMIAISESSDNKDGAWEYIKSLLSEENQLIDDYSLPILKSAFDRQSQNVLENYDPYGQQVKDLYGNRITLKPVDKVLVQKIRTLTESVRHAAVFDSGINSIINEQTELFWSGGQSAEETAKQIQKKVEIYLKEIDYAGDSDIN